MTLVAGVLAVNAGFAAVGFALLGRSRWDVSWAGVALLVGAGAVGSILFLATILGLRLSWGLVALVALGLGVTGLVATAFFQGQTLEKSVHRVPPAAAAAFVVVAAICALGIAGGFRSSPWLDDVWGIWLPKGLALWAHGLDERLFVPNGEFVSFGVPDYPLWWSVVTSLDVRAVGDVDVRAVCAQLGLLVAAFVGAVARLLWDCVRPTVLAGSLLLLVLSPELWRHVQGGVADLPLAIYVGVAVVAGARWLQTGERVFGVLAGFALAVALQIKTEALPEVAALVFVGALFARRLALAGLALAAALPWLLWRWTHDVPSRADLDFSRVDRVPDAVCAVAEHVFDPTEWLVVVPLALVLAVAARQPKVLLVPAALAAVIVTAYWIDRDELGFVLATSAYRVVDPLVLCAAVLIPVLAESFLQQRESLREDRALVG